MTITIGLFVIFGHYKQESNSSGNMILAGTRKAY